MVLSLLLDFPEASGESFAGLSDVFTRFDPLPSVGGFFSRPLERDEEDPEDDPEDEEEEEEEEEESLGRGRGRGERFSVSIHLREHEKNYDFASASKIPVASTFALTFLPLAFFRTAPFILRH